MTLRVAAIAILLIAFYAISVQFIPTDLTRRGFGQKDNLVKVENVLYSSSELKVILVGSSMTALLYNDMLPRDWGNLAIGAGSSLTGLEIIERSHLQPSVVIVEVNMLMRPADNELLNDVYAQPMHSIRNYVPALRLRNHPTTLLFSFIEHAKGNGINARSEEKYRLGMAYHQNAFSTRLPATVVHARIESVQKSVRRLIDRGITVYFVRYPMDPKIAALPQIVDLLEVVKSRFPSGKANWIEVPADNNFTTTDGIHLDTPGAIRMAEVLAASIANVGMTETTSAIRTRPGHSYSGNRADLDTPQDSSLLLADPY